MNKPQWLKIGIVGKPHGIRGAFFVSGRSEPLDPSFRLLAFGQDPASAQRVELTSVATHQGRSVVTCPLATTRTEAEKLGGLPIWIPSDQVKVDDATEYLWSDLIGRKVLDQDGVSIGSVLSVRNYGASDVLEIRRDDEARAELPLTPDFFDMSFRRGEDSLRLVVEAESFADMWAQRRKKGRRLEKL